MPLLPVFVMDSLTSTNSPYLKKRFSLEPEERLRAGKGQVDNTEEETWVTQ